MPKPGNATPDVARCHPERRHVARGLCKACYDREYANANREKINARKRAWAAANPERRIAHRRKYLYGIDAATFVARLAAQDGRCKICDIAQGTDLDHNHATGTARSVLCGDCNRALGLFRESRAALRRAIAYLELWEGPTARATATTGMPCCGT